MEIRCDECNKLMRIRGAKRYKDKLLCYNCFLKKNKIHLSLYNKYKYLNNINI